MRDFKLIDIIKNKYLENNSSMELFSRFSNVKDKDEKCTG